MFLGIFTTLLIPETARKTLEELSYEGNSTLREDLETGKGEERNEPVASEESV
jgi:hypothetical protein